MSRGGLPVVSGSKLVKALERDRWRQTRRRGSHVRMKHPDRPHAVTVPLHRELKRGTLAGILADAGIDVDRLRELM